MAAVQVYRGSAGFEDLPLLDFICRLESGRAQLVAPFSPPRLGVIADLSARLLADRRILGRPALAYFAHWIRRSALRELAARFEASAPLNTLAAPRGVVLHIPPKNVETIFLFSWITSYLVGNANVVRLPSDCSAAVLETVDLLIERLSSEGDIANTFIRYPAVDAVNEALCRASDVRMVWGGDAKIQAFESLPLRNGGKSIWFGDRYSYSVISGPALAVCTPNEVADLAQALALDVFTFDQMGCASPHKIYVVGEFDVHGPAVSQLLEAVRSEARRRRAEVPVSHAIRKLTEALALAGSEQGAFVPELWSDLVSVHFDHLRRTEDRVGGGFLVVEFIPDLGSLIDTVRSSHQTLTYYGFARTELADFARTAMLKGVSRIVPMGQALDFDAVWDGYDLMRELTRTVRLR